VGNICRAIHQVTSKRTLLLENIRIEDFNFGHHDINTIREFLENERGVILSAEISALERVLDSFHVAIVGWFHVNPNAVIANRLWDALADVYILDSSALHVKLEFFRIVRSYVTRFELCDRLTFFIMQEAALKRLKHEPDIIAAALSGNSAVIMDHIIANPQSVYQKDNRFHNLFRSQCDIIHEENNTVLIFDVYLYHMN